MVVSQVRGGTPAYCPPEFQRAGEDEEDPCEKGNDGWKKAMARLDKVIKVSKYILYWYSVNVRLCFPCYFRDTDISVYLIYR